MNCETVGQIVLSVIELKGILIIFGTAIVILLCVIGDMVNDK